ncbi:DEAD/DEAH box helicase [Tieghemostelium lacteum]|uniref:DEAD/DEAH box helicase n=1 Tax=Tieghemostelium lacteum TaxID=361077 RepID=A0A151ZAM7_TIELA|nr:DEAD/DEAH box helicase [Tieghemostelium lacteum]|eukprot:KYQ90995.1 DEAD/DEAH box helicase [Tieghemostelium lacteum]
MSEQLARSKQFEYKANSNLVIHSERNYQELREPKGEAESLWGKLKGNMGDRISFAKPNDLVDAQKKRKTMDNSGIDKKTGSKVEKDIFKKSKHSHLDVLAATDRYEGLYRPKTNETKIIYEKILTFIQSFIGDHPQEILKGAADEIISILKDDALKVNTQKSEISKLLKGMTEERFSDLVRMGKLITDFQDSTKSENTSGNTMNSLDDNQGVAVIIDEEDEEDQDSQVYEIKNLNSDDEEDDENRNNEDQDEIEDKEGSKIKKTSSMDSDDSDSDQEDTKSRVSRLHNLTKDQVNPLEIDSFWIQRKISQFESDPLVSQRLSDKVLDILKLTDTRKCENELVDLLDITKFDFIKLLLNNKLTILYCTLLAKSENEMERKKLESEMSNNPILIPILAKLKGEKTAKISGANSNVDKKKSNNNNDVVMTSSTNQKMNNKKILNLDELTFQQGSHLMTNKEFKFPKGSVREQYKGYEEVLVPAKKNPPFTNEERLVDIEEMPEWARLAFEGVKSLNRVQSRLYEWAFKTNDNLLLSAPTSAGKTNVAMLTILHEIGLHMHDGQLDLDSFKIVYIAPMKSLVQEVVSNFGNRLKPYGIVVNELTGDQSLSNKQISETQIIVTTPEKWDIITRKSGDRAYTQLVKLIIIDEIHLLHDERGPILECIVARTLRMIESTQEMIRLVGLSATLPNYEDVGIFLRVKEGGVFYFDQSYRPIPLQQQYIGISDRGVKQLQLLNEITYNKVSERVGEHQILVFVHSRRETAKTGKDIRDRAIEADIIGKFVKKLSTKEVLRSEAEKHAKSQDLKDLLPYGIGIHHAGMTRTDRTLVEELFGDKHIQVLISTSTLAWGVNLPAHTVIIKGTQVYQPDKGWTELSPLDVTQMLGRAGRPSFDNEGEGIVITSQKELQFYLSLTNTQLSIESQFISRLPDNLNAEIVLGTIQTLTDAVHWLGYTYLYICMLRNPTLYEISFDEIQNDPRLEQRRIDLVHSAAIILEKNGLIKYDRKSGKFQTTDLGKVASHYYITSQSMSIYNEHLRPTMNEIEFFRLFSMSSEFKNVSVRDGEKFELEKLLERVPIPVKETIDEPSSKINVLLQTYITDIKLDGFALVVDMFYIAQSASRICRALFEMVLKKGWAQLARKILTVCKMVDRKMWASQSPLRQFPEISQKILNQLERRGIPIEDLFDFTQQQLGSAIQNNDEGKKLHKLIHNFPRLALTAHVQPILKNLLKVELTLQPEFNYDKKYHDSCIGWWIIVEDVDGERILYYEYFNLKERMMEDEHLITFTVPLTEPLPPQYYVRVVADRWLSAEYNLSISFRHLILPDKYPPCRSLLDLQPMHIRSLEDDPKAQRLFQDQFKVFNSIQTQCFNTLYNSDDNTLIAAPTNSGKTVCAELALLRLFKQNPSAKAVYLAPVADLASLRFRDWFIKFGKTYSDGKLIVSELTGDSMTDNKILERSNLIVTTCEKWDILSRRWKQRKAIQSIRLLIVDEMHLIGGTYGPVLEVVVSRMRYITKQTQSPIRIVALSSSIANARDIVMWIGATANTCYNFHPNVRPIQLEVAIQGFDYPHFNARMLAMTKPAIYEVSRNKNAQSIIFVPNKKLSRSLARDLIAFVDSEEDLNRKPYLVCSEEILQKELQKIESVALRQSLEWGIAFYHEGLTEVERRTVENLFRSGAIRVLIATHSVCWSLDVYAQLVVIMGTQVYQGKQIRYVDYPINDVLQMIGRAGNQQNHNEKTAKCLLLCHQPKKDYYKMFLNEPLPVESHLDHCLHDHFNSEIVTKTITKKQDALDYLTWTFYYRRLNQNPNYYNLTGTSNIHLSEYLSELVENTLLDLERSNCVSIVDDDKLSPLNLGFIASYYYLKYQTIELFGTSLKSKTNRKGILEILSTAPEFEQIPIRHREEQMIQKMAAHLPLKIDAPNYAEVNTKVNVLLQAFFSRSPISADLYLDQKFILEQSTRLLQAMVDVISSSSWLSPAIATMELSQMCTQALWDNDSPLVQLPHMTSERIKKLNQSEIESVFDVISVEEQSLVKLLKLTKEELQDIQEATSKYPDVNVSYQVQDEEDLHSGDQITLEVVLERGENQSVESQDVLVHAPFYPKEKIESWWVLVGDQKNNQLLAIKRIAFSQKTKVKLEFQAPSVGQHDFTLYLMSDSYTGCDQEYELNLDIKQATMDEDDEDEDNDDQMQS